MDKIKEDVIPKEIPKDNVVNYDSLDTKLKTRIKDICDSYEQDIPSNIILELFPDTAVYRFKLNTFGVYNYYEINEYQVGGLIAYFKKEVEAEKCISILHQAVNTDSFVIYDDKENRTHDVKFIIKKVKIEILVYAGVKNETKIIH